MNRNTKQRNLVRVLSAVAGIIAVTSMTASAALSPSGGYSSPYFQADYIQDIGEFSSGIINPALLYRVNQMRIELGAYRWGVNADETSELGYQHASFLYPIRLNQTAGLSVIGLGSSIDQTEISSGGTAIESIGKARFGDMWFVGHYAARLRPWFMLGLNPKLLMQNQFSSGRSFGFGLDAGIYLNPLDHYRFGDLGFSLTFQDFVPAKIKWEHKVDGVVSDYVMTTRLRVGARYAQFNDKLVGAVEVIVDNMFIDLWKEVYKTIKESELQGVNDLSPANLTQKIPRYGAHLKFEFIPQVWLKGGWNNNHMPYLGLSANFIYPLPEMINYARADFHVGYSVTEPERGLAIMTKLATDFGYTREQKESRRLYNLLILAPMNAYLEAMRLYSEKKYWEASFAFGKVLSLYPNFHLNDRATYYMGNCYRFLRMNDIAREVYREGLAEYTTSDVRANYLFGLEDLDYREGNYDNALKNHAFITNLYAEHEVRPEADYLAGQIHFLRKNYNAAEMLLNNIKEGDTTYLFAQYTLGVINILNNKTKAAIQNLTAIIKDTTTSADELLLQDAANNKLGQLYYEEVELRKAVETFSQVPEGSPVGDQAQMGIGWSWIKVNRPEEALKTINNFIVKNSQSSLVPEAFLLKGYALMLLKRNAEAQTAFETALSGCNKAYASEADLKLRREKYNQYIAQFAPTAQKIKKNALRKPTDKTLAERTEMKNEFTAYSTESKSFFDFLMLVDSNKDFFRRKEQIVADAEYALAKVMKILGTSKETQILQQQQQKAGAIDDEIEKLKQQLEQQEQGE